MRAMTEGQDELPALAAYLRVERVRARFTQRRLAAATGVNLRYLRRLEAGQRVQPSAALLGRLAGALQIDLETLLTVAGMEGDHTDGHAPSGEQID